MRSRLLFVLFACLLATALFTVGCGGGAGGDDSISSPTSNTTSVGNLAGSVNPTEAASSLRAQSLENLTVTLQYYDDNNNLQDVPGVSPTTTDSSGKYSFKNIPTSFLNLIIAVRLANGSFLKGFIPAVKANTETTIPEINKTIASITYLLDAAADYRRRESIPGRYHINMGDIMSTIKPSELVTLSPGELAQIAQLFVRRERTMMDNMNNEDLATYRNAAFEKARELCETMANNGGQSLIGLDDAWVNFDSDLRDEMKVLPPDAIAIFQQADGLIASLPDLVPGLPVEIKDQITTGYAQSCYINNLYAVLKAIRILSEGLLNNVSELSTIETGMSDVTSTMERASSEEGVSQAFTGNFTPDLIYAQIKAVFNALGLLAGDPPLITQILPKTMYATNDPAENRKLAMQAARTNLDTLLSGNATLAGKLNTEDKKQALVFLLFALGDIGVPLPFDPGQTEPGTGPVEPVRNFFGLLINATTTYEIDGQSYPYVIVPPPGFPPAPEGWGCLVYVRPAEGVILKASETARIEACVTFEQEATKEHAPAGVVTAIKPAGDGNYIEPVTPSPVPMAGKIAKNADGVICIFPGGLEEGFLIIGATQEALGQYLDKWVSVAAYPIEQEGAKPVFKFDMTTIRVIEAPPTDGTITPIDSGTVQMIFGAIKPLVPEQTINGQRYTHVIYDPTVSEVSLNPKNQLYIRAGENVVLESSSGKPMISHVRIEAVFTETRPALGVVVDSPTPAPTIGGIGL